METSKGHIFTCGEFEYFERGGEVFRAYLGNPIDTQGYRQGGRWECSVSFLPRLRAVLSVSP